MHKLRALKSTPEIEALQHACDITEKGFRRLLSFVKPGVMEYEIEAELLQGGPIGRIWALCEAEAGV